MEVFVRVFYVSYVMYAIAKLGVQQGLNIMKPLETQYILCPPKGIDGVSLSHNADHQLPSMILKKVILVLFLLY
jgi:hypothetical protein